MEALVELSQTPLVDMSIDLGRGDIGVAEHRLNRPEIRAMLQQVSGETVAHSVSLDRLLYACLQARTPRCTLYRAR